jgi:hypothetical protein
MVWRCEDVASQFHRGVAAGAPVLHAPVFWPSDQFLPWWERLPFVAAVARGQGTTLAIAGNVPTASFNHDNSLKYPGDAACIR